MHIGPEKTLAGQGKQFVGRWQEFSIRLSLDTLPIILPRLYRNIARVSLVLRVPSFDDERKRVSRSLQCNQYLLPPDTVAQKNGVWRKARGSKEFRKFGGNAAEGVFLMELGADDGKEQKERERSQSSIIHCLQRQWDTKRAEGSFRCAFRSRSLNWMALYAAEIERQRTFACLYHSIRPSLQEQ